MELINEIVTNIENLNLNIEIFGWIKKIRKLGSIIFMDIYDISGTVQVFLNSNNKFYENVYSCTKESVVKINGILKNRKSINNEIPTGHVEIELNNFEIISVSKTPPFLIQEDTDGLEDLRLKYRYLDLRRSNMQHNLIFRSRFIQSIREFLHRKNFIEIETPILSKITLNGANEYLVNAKKDLYFSLAQSPQIYKQLLMASGFVKYFQIAKCFRNEDLRLDRQPEFTQLDIEFSFIKEEQIFSIIESLLKDLFLKNLNIKLDAPFNRIKYDESIKLYGTDKPNIGYDYKIFDSTDFLKKSIFFKKIIESNKKVNAIIINDLLIEKKYLNKIEKFAKDNGSSGLITVLFNDGKIIGGSLNNKIEDEIIKNIFDYKKIKKGTIFFDFNYGNLSNKILGSIRNAVIDVLNIKPKNLYNFIWIIDWPLFEYCEKEKKIISVHHPFTAPKLNFLNEKLENAKARSYDLVLNGFEIGGGSIRINNKELQENIFKILKINKKDYENYFGFLLDSFEFGFPQHGGIALGLDRILMIVLNANSIRDVIAFPKSSSGFDLMMESPNKK